MPAPQTPEVLNSLTVLGRALFNREYPKRPRRESDNSKKSSREDYAQGFVGALKVLEEMGLHTGLLLPPGVVASHSRRKTA